MLLPFYFYPFLCTLLGVVCLILLNWLEHKSGVSDLVCFASWYQFFFLMNYSFEVRDGRLVHYLIFG